MPYSEKLKQSYNINPDKTVTFQDGTNYNMNEMSLIKNSGDSIVVMLHKLKSAFLGEIVAL